MKGLFIPDITAEMFRNGCLEGIEELMAEGEIYDIDYTGWIPVSETSFLQAGEYLATAEDGNGFRFTDKFGYTPTRDGGWYDPEEPNQADVDWNKWIIAWMPLPEPYNGDTRGEE